MEDVAESSQVSCFAHEVSTRPLPPARANALAAKLDIGLDIGICHACLSLVSMALDGGIAPEITGRLCQMTPFLWDEGLAGPVLVAVREACDLGVPDAAAALDDLERRGGRSWIARAIVRRLAAELTRRTRIELRLESIARDRLLLAPPELN